MFIGEDLILVQHFLTIFVKEADTLGVFDAHAFVIMLKLLRSQGKRHLRLVRNGSRSGGVAYSPKIGNHFFELMRPQRPFETP